MKNMSLSRRKVAATDRIVNRKIEEQFTLRDATVYGGYNLYSDMVARSGLDRLLEETFSGWKARWARYNLPTVVRILIDGYALGMKRIWHFADLRRDALLCAKRGLESLPDQSLLRKDLSKHFHSEEQVDKLRKIKARQARGVLKRLGGPLVLEFDSTVETVYGCQEGAEAGYNPHKPGRLSYQVQLCRERRSGLTLWSRLQPGNCVSATDFVRFLEQSWQVLPRRFQRHRKGALCKVLVRMDRGYATEEIFRWLEKQAIGYVVKMRMTCSLWTLLLSLSGAAYRRRQTEAGPIEVCSLCWHPPGWSRPRRIVIVRWPEETERAQTDLFDALGYTYAAFVTNLDWDEQDVCRFYDKRADVENHIQEAKADLGIGHIPTQNFHVNAADLELRLLAHNQLLLFSRNVLCESQPRPRASTIRRKWLVIAGKLIRDGRRRILKLAQDHPLKHLWPLYRFEVARL
jgi:hypothetical protein